MLPGPTMAAVTLAVLMAPRVTGGDPKP
jgi:hypothetical protein